jgi:ferritin-like metal-binding protein YciE
MDNRHGQEDHMGLFSHKRFDTMEELLVDQLEDLYDAEKRLVKALPLMEAAAHDDILKDAFRMHLRQTEDHVARLEQAFRMMGRKAHAETCEAMKGLVAEGQEAIKASGEPEVKDAALIAAAQRVEHYEIAGYGTVRSFALRIGRRDVADLLQRTLDEEKATDKKLTAIAEESVNKEAVGAAV